MGSRGTGSGRDESKGYGIGKDEVGSYGVRWVCMEGIGSARDGVRRGQVGRKHGGRRRVRRGRVGKVRALKIFDTTWNPGYPPGT